MDFDELKMAWKAQSQRLDKLEQQNLELQRKIGCNNISNKRAKLLSSYRIFIIVAFLMGPCVIFTFPILDLPNWIALSYAAVMVMLGIFNCYIYNMIRKINLATMTTKEALEQVIKLDKRRQQLRVVGCIIAAILMILFFRELWLRDEPSGIVGGAVGGIIGAIVGIKKEREIRAMIRSMQADLEELCAL